MIVTMPNGRRISCPTGMTIREAFAYARNADYAIGEMETAATRPKINYMATPSLGPIMRGVEMPDGSFQLPPSELMKVFERDARPRELNPNAPEDLRD